MGTSVWMLHVDFPEELARGHAQVSTQWDECSRHRKCVGGCKSRMGQTAAVDSVHPRAAVFPIRNPPR
jgi:hypothetical protein